MNIAFPALLIFLLILPGLFFTLTFYNTDSKPINYVSLTHKTAFSLLFTIALHLTILLIILYCAEYQVKLSSLLIMLTGAHGIVNDGVINSIQNKDILLFITYLLISYLLSFLIGKLLRYCIKRFKLEKFKLFRINSPWYYLFTGFDWENNPPDGVIISAGIDLAGQGYLYKGYLDDFYLDDDGNIDRLVLTSPERRIIEKDKTADPNTHPTENRFYSIDSDYFVLKYSDIKNLNVQFIELHPES